MALKPKPKRGRPRKAQLAVPSYGAMALKPREKNDERNWIHSCSPLLRGDGPETCQARYTALGYATCSPLLRGDGPETASRADRSADLVHSCSPLLRGDGPETCSKRGALEQLGSCSPLLRGDGPETRPR